MTEPITVTVTAGLQLQPRSYEQIACSVVLNNVSPETSATELKVQLDAAFRSAADAYVDAIRYTRQAVSMMDAPQQRAASEEPVVPRQPLPPVARDEPLPLAPVGLPLGSTGDVPPPLGRPFSSEPLG